MLHKGVLLLNVQNVCAAVLPLSKSGNVLQHENHNKNRVKAYITVYIFFNLMSSSLNLCLTNNPKDFKYFFLFYFQQKQ